MIKDLKEFHHADKLMECELKRLETEHNALKLRLKAFKRLLKITLEASFKTFWISAFAGFIQNI